MLQRGTRYDDKNDDNDDDNDDANDDDNADDGDDDVDAVKNEVSLVADHERCLNGRKI